MNRRLPFGAAWLPMILCVVLLAGVPLAAAAEGSGDWRPQYDTIMKWINFLILVVIVVKVGKNPLMNYLRGQRDQMANEMEHIQRQKDKAVQDIRAAETALADSELAFAELQQKIIALGEKEKERIIAEARNQSQMMLDAAKQRIQSRIIQAKEQFSAELIDSAMAIAVRQLPTMISPADNERLIETFLHATAD